MRLELSNVAIEGRVALGNRSNFAEQAGTDAKINVG